MQQFKLNEAQTRLKELVDDAIRGESVFILTEEEEMVQLVPVALQAEPRKPGSARGLITIGDDFDAPLEDLAEYMS